MEKHFKKAPSVKSLVVSALALAVAFAVLAFSVSAVTHGPVGALMLDSACEACGCAIQPLI